MNEGRRRVHQGARQHRSGGGVSAAFSAAQSVCEVCSLKQQEAVLHPAATHQHGEDAALVRRRAVAGAVVDEHCLARLDARRRQHRLEARLVGLAQHRGRAARRRLVELLHGLKVPDRFKAPLDAEALQAHSGVRRVGVCEDVLAHRGRHRSEYVAHAVRVQQLRVVERRVHLRAFLCVSCARVCVWGGV